LKRDQLAFLLGGAAFGVLVGYGLFNALASKPVFAPPQANAPIDGPRGPAAMTQVPMGGGGAPAGAPGGGAPMVAEINSLKQALKDDPKNLKAAVRLANLYQDIGELDQAIPFYERALELAPKDPNVLTDLGICYEQLQQFDRALELFRRAQSEDANHWQSLYNIVVVAGFHLGRVEEADKALARLEQVNPNAPNLASLKDGMARVKGGGTGGATP
jgi:hypothetical protein